MPMWRRDLRSPHSSPRSQRVPVMQSAVHGKPLSESAQDTSSDTMASHGGLALQATRKTHHSRGLPSTNTIWKGPCCRSKLDSARKIGSSWILQHHAEWQRSAGDAKSKQVTPKSALAARQGRMWCRRRPATPKGGVVRMDGSLGHKACVCGKQGKQATPFDCIFARGHRSRWYREGLSRAAKTVGPPPAGVASEQLPSSNSFCPCSVTGSS